MRSPGVGTSVQRSVGWWDLRLHRAFVEQLSQGYRLTARRGSVRPGVTVVTASRNSLGQLRIQLLAIERFTAEPIDVIVVDNHSTDGTRQFLQAHPTVRPLLLPLNVGHGGALNLGLLAARTSTVVTLDIDAFPIAATWLSSVTEPIAHGSAVAGAHLHRGYIHPCFLAMRRSDFVDYGLSFVPIGRLSTPREPVPLFLDTGEALSHRLSMVYGTESIHRIPPTSTRGPGVIGTVFGDVVYHNFYSTHGESELNRAAASAWQEAVQKYLGGGS